MRSPEPSTFPEVFAGSSSGSFKRWNRRFHYFLGLYFLLFVWLFAFTGLLLNHGSWRFAEFWTNRKISTFEQAIRIPPAGGELAVARDILGQLGISGEIAWVNTPPDPMQLNFRATRAGLQFDIKADLARQRATIQRTDLNAWGVLRTLHTFTGVRQGDTRNERDWILTTAWVVAMDAVAIGLVVMVLNGVIMWWALDGKRIPGSVALGIGVLVCGWFVFGLRWFFA